MSNQLDNSKLNIYFNRIKNKLTLNKLITKLNYYITKKKKEEYNKILKERKKIFLKYKKKRKDLIKFLDKNYKRKYIHLSNKELTLNKFKNLSKNNSSWLGLPKKIFKYYNPRGLWISCGSDWIKFIDKEIAYLQNPIDTWSKCKFIYEIIINEKEVLKINKVKDLINFHKKYGKYYKKTKSYDINWKLVKKEYYGLIICPYLGDKIWKNTNLYFYLNNKSYKYIKNSIANNIKKYPKFYLEWYRHWESGSGVIWNKKGINEIKLIKKYVY